MPSLYQFVSCSRSNVLTELPWLILRKYLYKVFNKLCIFLPTYAQINTVNLYEITPKCLGANTPSSGSLQVVLAKVMNY
jgi:hypothetical protein